VDAEILQLGERLTELRGQETEQRKTVEKIDKGRSLSSLAHRYREAVEKIKKQAAIQLREQVSAVVGDLWVDIAERELEFKGMDFDASWNCLLRKRDGSQIVWELVQTSAGQKQVRLLAFTEALRRLARLAPPLVVDTPLARLDKEVRRAVLERLYLAGHQSIILTTNAEIDPESDQFDRIKDQLARVYTLHPEGNPASNDYIVRVSDDYFGRSL
jgi:DNA sulfur modification protein DndD